MAIDSKKRDGVAYITLNNPAKANILDKQTSDQISEAWIDLWEDRSIRCAILTGTGDKHFCGGHNLAKRKNITEEEREYLRTQRIFWPLAGTVHGQKTGVDGRFGDQELGFVGAAPGPTTLSEIERRAVQATGRAPVVVPGDGRAIRRVAWCTGGAQGYFEAAIAAGADVYITGEISEPQAHIARETGVAFIACGHHASERDGAAAVGAHLAQHFGLQHEFIDIANPG